MVKATRMPGLRSSSLLKRGWAGQCIAGQARITREGLAGMPFRLHLRTKEV